MWGKNVQGSNDENVLPTTWPAAAFPAQFVSKYLLHVCVFAERWSVNLQFFLLSGCSHNHCFVEEIKTSGKQFPVNIWSILAQTLLSKPSIKTLQQCCLIPCCVLTALSHPGALKPFPPASYIIFLQMLKVHRRQSHLCMIVVIELTIGGSNCTLPLLLCSS